MHPGDEWDERPARREGLAEHPETPMLQRRQGLAHAPELREVEVEDGHAVALLGRLGQHVPPWSDDE